MLTADAGNMHRFRQYSLPHLQFYLFLLCPSELEYFISLSLSVETLA
jgi:hypothetical protein